MIFKDVKKILDIPNIEDYLTNEFELLLFDVVDRLVIFTCDLPNGDEINLEIMSDELLIEGKDDLAGILTHYDVAFLQWIVYNDLEEMPTAFMYRPLVDEVSKDYI